MKKILLTSVASLAIAGVANATTQYLNQLPTAGGTGSADIFNETDGGGVKLSGDDGSISFVGVHAEDGNNASGRLYSLDENLNGSRLAINQDGIYYTKGAKPSSFTSDDEIATVGAVETLTEAISASNTKLQNDVFALDSKVNELDENLSAGIASSVALSSVAVANVERGEVSVGGGYGNYNAKSAMAFGAAMGITDNWSANAGVGLGFGKDTKASFRVGTNYKFKLF